MTGRLVRKKHQELKCDTSSDSEIGNDGWSDDSSYNSNDEYDKMWGEKVRRSQIKRQAARDDKLRKQDRRKRKLGNKKLRDWLQGSKGEIELIVPTSALNWTSMLYIFSRLLVGAGLGILIYGIMVFAAPRTNTKRILPHYTAGFFVGFGSVSFLLGILAWMGGDKAVGKLRHGQRNCWLLTLNIVLSMQILFFAFSIILLFVWGDSILNKTMETYLLDSLKVDSATGSALSPYGQSSWYDIQKFLLCCGWSEGTNILGKGTNTLAKPHSVLATGKWCTSQTSTTGMPCQQAIGHWLVKQGHLFIIAIIVYITIHLAVLIASIFLTYVIKAHTPFQNV